MLNMTEKENKFFEQILALDFEGVLEFLNKNKVDFNKFKTKRGFGFLFTLLRRFNVDDFISEEVKYEDLIKMLKILFDYGLEINKETSTSYLNSKYDFGNILSTEVVSSVELKNMDLAELLISKGADINYEDSYGNIPLFFANHYDLSVKYLDNTKNPCHINKNNENALFYQVKHLRVIKLLLGAGLDPYLINKNGDSLVLHCVRYGTPEVLDYILKHTDLDPNYENPITKENVLFTVKHKKMLDVLVKYNLNIHLLNDKEQTVLFTTNNKVSFVKTLIKYNLDINHQDKYGDTILHKPNTEGLIEVLATSGFNFNLKNKLGDTVIDFYKKRNAEDLYGSHQATIDLILDKIQEQERIKKAKEKQNQENLAQMNYVDDEIEEDD